MITKAGLIGLFQSPKYREQFSPIYMIADGDTSSLFIFVLFPGAYDDAYEIASQTVYHHIFIVPTSMEAMYISDVYRLASDLMRIKQSVNVIYPNKFAMHVPPAIENSLLRGNASSTTAFVYQNGYIAFDWGIEKPIEDPIYHRGFHDIYINFNNRRVLFCPHEVNKDRIINMLENNDVDYVYLPYARPMFGDDSYITLIEDEDFKEYADKLIAFGFANSTEAKMCWENHPNAFPVTFRWLFLNTYNWDSEEVNYVAVSDRPWSPHYYPKHEYPYPLERIDLGLTIEDPSDEEESPSTPSDENNPTDTETPSDSENTDENPDDSTGEENPSSNEPSTDNPPSTDDVDTPPAESGGETTENTSDSTTEENNTTNTEGSESGTAGSESEEVMPDPSI